jgi:HD-GYP domain-containing protein (c-di-GMP phosphodiesterase class II)
LPPGLKIPDFELFALLAERNLYSMSLTEGGDRRVVKSPNPQTEESGGRSHFKRNSRIVFTLLAVLVFVGLVPLATVAWKLIDINREALTTSQQEYQLLLVSSMAHEIDIHVEGLDSELVRVAQTLGGAVRRSGSGKQEEIRRILADVVDKRMPYIRYTHFRGQEAESISQGSMPESLEPVFTSGLRETAAGMVSTVKSRPDHAILSDPVLLDSIPRQAVMVASAPVVSGGRFRGVLSALVDLQRVWNAVVARNRTGHLVFALDRSGQVIASTNPVTISPGQDLRNSSALISRFLSGEGRARETIPFMKEIEGSEHQFLGSYEVTGLGWGLFVQAELQDVYHPVSSMMRSTMAWALGALGLAVLAALVFAGKLSKPIKRLAAASRAFASGKYATRVEIRSKNEIGELAHTFNTMASDIEGHIRKLKRAADENNELFISTIRTLAKTIDAKDPYTKGHSERVNRYAVIISRELGLSPEEINDIHVASLMHDLGKIGIDDSILKKSDKLTDEEFEIMKTHTECGAQIMMPIKQMHRILAGVRSHHEKWEGGGYPDGLVGEQIPLMARIIAVADTFDAISTQRPYQRARTFAEALDILNSSLKGKALDERVVEAFNRAYHKGLIKPEQSEQIQSGGGIEAVPA